MSGSARVRHRGLGWQVACVSDPRLHRVHKSVVARLEAENATLRAQSPVGKTTQGRLQRFGSRSELNPKSSCFYFGSFTLI